MPDGVVRLGSCVLGLEKGLSYCRLLGLDRPTRSSHLKPQDPSLKTKFGMASGYSSYPCGLRSIQSQALPII